MAVNDAPQAKPAERIPSPPPPTVRRAATGSMPRVGIIPIAGFTVALLVLLRVLAALLIVLSFVGSMAGLQGKSMPLSIEQASSMLNAWGVAGLVLQAVLMIAQWGARGLARYDRRWWLLYIGSLGISSLLNWICYAPILAGLPILFVLLVVIGGDMLPELTLVKEEK